MRNLGATTKITDASLAFVLSDNTQLTLSGDVISQGGLSIETSTSVDGAFTIGGAVTGQVKVTLFNSDESLSGYDFRDATVTVSLIGPDSEDNDVTTQIGVYTVVDFKYDSSNISLTAYDNLCKFDHPCTETGSVTVAFPMSLTGMVQTACSVCGVTLVDNVTPIPNGSYQITQQPSQWESMTWHDVISYCAQIGGCFAKVDKYGRLYFDWYTMPSSSNVYGGGSFNTSTTPYSDGDPLDGGSFSTNDTPYSDGGTANGGAFGDRADYHVIPAPYALTVDTDDVYITGLQVVLEASDNINATEDTGTFTTTLSGTEGYVVTISGNPFIETTDNANAVRDFLDDSIVGMLFRPLTSTIVEDATVEAGDSAYITGRSGNTFLCFISRCTYSVGAATVITCDAESSKSSSKKRFTMGDKANNTITHIQKQIKTVSSIAGNTNQYFWHTETGTDTGAHITEVPKDEWNDSTSQHYHSGGNLLARSNGIAVRDGLNELAQFKADGMSFLDVYNTKTFDVDTNIPASTRSFSEVALNITLTRNEPYTYTVQNPCFISFVNTGMFYASLTDPQYGDDSSSNIYPDYSSDFDVTVMGTWQLEIQYSYNDGSFTFTYKGTDAHGPQVILDFECSWFSSLYGSAYSLGNRRGTKGSFSAVIGEGLKAEYANQISIGRYNINRSEDIFEVGDGESVLGASNLLELKKTSGNMMIRGTLNQGSDRRLKEHKSYLDDDAVQFIRNLKPAYFIKDGENHVGFYAQDVAEIDKWDCMTGEMNEYMTLGYTELIAPLVRYCQKLEERIKELEER